jgi:hypothetical protein
VVGRREDYSEDVDSIVDAATWHREPDRVVQRVSAIVTNTTVT